MLQRGSLVGGNAPVTVCLFLRWPAAGRLCCFIPVKENPAGIAGRGSAAGASCFQRRPAFRFIPVKENPAGITGRGSAEAIRRPGSIEAPALSCRPGMLQRETLVGSNTPLIVCRFLCWPAAGRLYVLDVYDV